MPRQSQITASPGWPFGEAFAAVIGPNYPPPGLIDPPFVAGQNPAFAFPRRYDWTAHLGFQVAQPTRLWRASVVVEDEVLITCENTIDEWAGRAINLSERRYSAGLSWRVVPEGTPVLMMVGFPPNLINTDQDCSELPGVTLEETEPPLFCFDLFLDPFSAYCLCDPETNANCPPVV